MWRHLLGLMGVSLKIRACEQEETSYLTSLVSMLFLGLVLFFCAVLSNIKRKLYLLQHSTLLQMLERVRPTS